MLEKQLVKIHNFLIAFSNLFVLVANSFQIASTTVVLVHADYKAYLKLLLKHAVINRQDKLLVPLLMRTIGGLSKSSR